MGKDALESSSGGDAPKLVLDIEHEFLDRYQLCIKAVVKMLIGENRLNKWLAAGWLHVTLKFHVIFTFFQHHFVTLRGIVQFISASYFTILCPIVERVVIGHLQLS